MKRLSQIMLGRMIQANGLYYSKRTEYQQNKTEELRLQFRRMHDLYNAYRKNIEARLK